MSRKTHPALLKIWWKRKKGVLPGEKKISTVAVAGQPGFLFSFPFFSRAGCVGIAFFISFLDGSALSLAC